MPLRAILFDADGVIQRTPQNWLADLAARLELDPARAEDLLSDLFDAERPTLVGTGDFRSALAAVLDRWDRSRLLEVALVSWHEIEVDHEMLAVVDRLREQGLRCCLATNQQDLRAAYMRRGLGYDLRFDDQFYSCELGVAKPDAAYFTTVLDRLGLRPGEVLFIDDSARNVDMAAELGLRTILHTPGQAIAGLPTTERQA